MKGELGSGLCFGLESPDEGVLAFKLVGESVDASLQRHGREEG